MTPLDLGLQSQRVFRSIGIFCHGFLAGLAFWQLLMVFILSKGDVELMDFIELYSPLSQPLHLVFYFLTVICTISILDRLVPFRHIVSHQIQPDLIFELRYDIAQFDWRQVQMLLTFKSGGFAILIYVFTLIVTLVTTHIDDKLSLYQYNSTLFELTDPTVMNFTSLHLIRHSIPISISGIAARNHDLESPEHVPINRCNLGLDLRVGEAKH